jgi:hypothetical protein
MSFTRLVVDTARLPPAGGPADLLLAKLRAAGTTAGQAARSTRARPRDHSDVAQALGRGPSAEGRNGSSGPLPAKAYPSAAGGRNGSHSGSHHPPDWRPRPHDARRSCAEQGVKRRPCTYRVGSRASDLLRPPGIPTVRDQRDLADAFSVALWSAASRALGSCETTSGRASRPLSSRISAPRRRRPRRVGRRLAPRLRRVLTDQDAETAPRRNGP